MNLPKKLSLEEFKKTAKGPLKIETIERIAGGILGACHTTNVSYYNINSGQYTGGTTCYYTTY